jgi:hypothetical protein
MPLVSARQPLCCCILGSGYVGNVWVGDERTVLSLENPRPQSPGICHVFGSSRLFTAVCRVIKSAAVQLRNKLSASASLWAPFPLSRHPMWEYACAAIVVGGVVGEIAFLHHVCLRCISMTVAGMYPGGKKPGGSQNA